MNRKEFNLLVEGWKSFLNEDNNLENINNLSEEVYNLYFEKVYNYTPTILEYEFKRKLGISENEDSLIFKRVPGKTQEELYQKFLKQEVKGEYNVNAVRNALESMPEQKVQMYLENIHFIPLEFSYLWESGINTEDLTIVKNRIEDYKEYLRDTSDFIPSPFYSHVDLKEINKGDYYFDFSAAAVKYSYIDQAARKV